MVPMRHGISITDFSVGNPYISMKALKCKTLGAELAHAYIVHTQSLHCIIVGLSAFYVDDHLPTLNAHR